MGHFDQFVRDVEALHARLQRLDPRNPGDVRDVLEVLQTQVTLVGSFIPEHVRLFRARTRVSNMLRDAVNVFILDPEPGLEPLCSCLRDSVLPYARGLANQASTPERRVHDDGTPGDLSGATLGNWKLGNCIGTGGHGSVYLADNINTGRGACVKAIPFADDRSDQEERFWREVKVPADVRHPALAEVLDADLSEEYRVFYFVMERIVGVSIDRWAAKRDVSEALSMFLHVLEPLAECHVRGLVHRDLKPSNIMITADAHVYILDFGLTSMAGRTRRTRSGEFLGTVNYVSPEQARDAHNVTQQSDIWSLGVVLYELVTGTTPFPQESDLAVLAAIQRGEFAPPEAVLSADLSAIVRRCLQVKAEDRYPRVEDLAQAIRSALHPTPDIPTDAVPARPRQPAILTVPVTAIETFRSNAPPLGEPTLSPWTNDFDTCVYCRAVGKWFGNRCAGCGRDRGTD